MRRLILGAVVGLWPLLAQADPIALQPDQVLRGHFVQDRFLAGFAHPVRSEGSFVLAPGRGLIWRGEKPFAVLSVITPAGMAQSLGGKPTMHLSAAQVPFLARLHQVMAGAMAGDWPAVEAEFILTRTGDRITLTPRGGELAQPVKAITARMDRFVEEVEVIKGEGDRDHLVFSQQGISRTPLSEDEAAAFALVK